MSSHLIFIVSNFECRLVEAVGVPEEDRHIGNAQVGVLASVAPHSCDGVGCHQTLGHLLGHRDQRPESCCLMEEGSAQRRGNTTKSHYRGVQDN